MQDAWFVVSFASSRNSGRLFARLVAQGHAHLFHTWQGHMFLLYFLEVPSGQPGMGTKPTGPAPCSGRLTLTHFVANGELSLARRKKNLSGLPEMEIEEHPWKGGKKRVRPRAEGGERGQAVCFHQRSVR